MPTIQLANQRWELGSLLGSGGFATVYEATDEDGRAAAVKLIPKSTREARDVLFADLDAVAQAPNVVPVLDNGETDTHWAIVMPVATAVLRNIIDAQQILPIEECRPVLLGVLSALAALDGKVVHRDLKPDNILLVDGKWCLGDFGIARYAEATTAPDTQKFAMTAAYAAPEQWRLERATAATDVYAFGVLMYEMLNGSRPFAGPTSDDYRQQHLHEAAPPLQHVDPGLAALVGDCLLKPAQARPSAQRLIERLERLGTVRTSAAEERLREVNLRVASVKSAAAAERERQRAETERRKELYDAAVVSLSDVLDELRNRIADAAPHAELTRGGWPITLGSASLTATQPKLVTGDAWGPYTPKFDVIACASMELVIPEDQWGYFGRGCSFWYCDAVRAAEYRWYEVAFMRSAFSSERTKGDPVMRDPGPESGVALSNVTGGWQLAWPFTPCDQGDSDDLFERWLEWLAAAASGQLHRPSSMPERSHEVLRRSYRTT